jgi:hypothetical protein
VLQTIGGFPCIFDSHEFVVGGGNLGFASEYHERLVSFMRQVHLMDDDGPMRLKLELWRYFWSREL